MAQIKNARKYDKARDDWIKNLDLVYYVNCVTCMSRHMSGSKETLLRFLWGVCPHCDSSLLDSLCVEWARGPNRIRNTYLIRNMYRRRADEFAGVLSHVPSDANLVFDSIVSRVACEDGEGSSFVYDSLDDCEIEEFLSNSTLVHLISKNQK